MAQTILNLAFPLVQKKVKDALQRYPASSYQNIPSEEHVISYVLRRIPAEYVATEDARACSVETPANCFSEQQQRQMDRLVYEGIQHLSSQQEQHRTPVAATAHITGSSMSTWFG